MQNGVRIRQEIEFTVGNFEAARRFLEALGYQVSMMYEKFRTSYVLDDLHIVLDELPYGSFVEIEGPEADAIQKMSARLGLDWSKSVPESYTMLFERLRSTLGFEFQDLSFTNFVGIKINAEVLQLYPADS
jgi:adenylate cyclase class 2